MIKPRSWSVPLFSHMYMYKAILMVLSFATDMLEQIVQFRIRLSWSSLIRVFTFCCFICTFCSNYSIVKPLGLSYRLFAAKLVVCVQIYCLLWLFNCLLSDENK